MGHEAGHCLLHVPFANFVSRNHGLGLLYREYNDLPPWKNAEWQAWETSRQLLMPEQVIRRCLAENYSIHDLAQRFQVNYSFAESWANILRWADEKNYSSSAGVPLNNFPLNCWRNSAGIIQWSWKITSAFQAPWQKDGSPFAVRGKRFLCQGILCGRKGQASCLPMVPLIPREWGSTSSASGNPSTTNRLSTEFTPSMERAFPYGKSWTFPLLSS